jgi:hypothetical protein
MLARLYLKNKPGIFIRAHTPSLLEAEVGGFSSNASPGKSTRPYMKNKLKAKGLGECSNGGTLAYQA